MIFEGLFEALLARRWKDLDANFDAFRAQFSDQYPDELVARWWSSVRGAGAPTFMTRGARPGKLPLVLVEMLAERADPSALGTYLGEDALGAGCVQTLRVAIFAGNQDQLTALVVGCRALLWLAAAELSRDHDIDGLTYQGLSPLDVAEAFEIEKMGGWGRAMTWEVAYTARAVPYASPAPLLPLRVNTTAVLASLDAEGFVLDEDEGHPGGVEAKE